MINYQLANRTKDIPRSFIREILKVAQQPDIISFAGGLPNKALFPADALKSATEEVFQQYGSDIYQYSNSEGYINLRKYIAENYAKQGVHVSVDDILITNGAQQGLDLLAKVLLDKQDAVLIEQPGYLGAIQAFALYEPSFVPINVNEDGLDINQLKNILADESKASKIKCIYTVPNFQNPSGISYSEENRSAVAALLKNTNILLIEDNPYGELRFEGDEKTSFKTLLPEHTLLLGSFSKVVIPGFRIGWVVAPKPIMDKLLIAKQAADLHTCHFTQYIIHQYLQKNTIATHIGAVASRYGEQCHAMLASMKKYFPASVKTTHPEGGMFLWVTLPEHISAMKLFDIALAEKVVFVPGSPFYIAQEQGVPDNTLRLNFSCTDTATIDEGMKRLGKAIYALMEA